jgi:hypothetical protein
MPLVLGLSGSTPHDVAVSTVVAPYESLPALHSHRDGSRRSHDRLSLYVRAEAAARAVEHVGPDWRGREVGPA